MSKILRNFYVRRILLLIGVWWTMSIVLTFANGGLSQVRWVLILAAFVVLIATVGSILRRMFAALRRVARRVLG